MINAEYQLGSITAIYYTKDEVLSLLLIPSDRRGEVKDSIFEWPDSLIQIHITGDAIVYPYAQGISMRNTQTTLALRLKEQHCEKEKYSTRITTVMTGDHGEECIHELVWNFKNYLSSRVTVKNTSMEEFTIQNLSSFSINGITPFIDGPANNSLRLHRFTSYWSGEGRHESRKFEDINMEPSWSKWATKSEMIKQIGTLPVRKYFPFYGIEDYQTGITWGAALEWAGSWQMEIYRRGDNVALSGGLADYEEGHWEKVLKPSECIQSPTAYLSCVNGSIDELCDALLEAQETNLVEAGEGEEELCCLYNEYCDTWGNPSYEKIKEQLEGIRDLGLRYFVIDAGWYYKGEWQRYVGDWEVNDELFPEGMKAVCDLIRSYGMIPGIWFEFEVAGDLSKNYLENKSRFVHRNGKMVCASNRVFLNMSDETVLDFLREKVIRFLKQNGFGYIKVDYNDTYGYGFDGFESYGEGLRKATEGVYQFFDEMRVEIPELIIENCSSGGHRLEPGMMRRSSMASFSDAHECKEIPLIAADLQKLILPRQSQIWSVIKETDDERRIAYSIINTLLGRMCISGPVHQLTHKQKTLIRKGVEFYGNVSEIIKNGKSRCIRSGVKAYGEPTGWQTVLRMSDDQNSALIVMNVFEIQENTRIMVDLPQLSEMKITDVYSEEGCTAAIDNNVLEIIVRGSFSGIGIKFEKIPSKQETKA